MVTMDTQDVKEVETPLKTEGPKDLRTVFVSNLSFGVTEELLRERFAKVRQFTHHIHTVMEAYYSREGEGGR